MNLIEFYFYANIYLVLFWVAYRISLHNSGHFQQVRFYLDSALILSLAFPFIHGLITEFISSQGGSQLKTAGNLPVINFGYTSLDVVSAPVNPSTKLTGELVISLMLLAGSTVTLSGYIIRYIRIIKFIYSLSRTKKMEDGISVYYSEEVEIPFIFYRNIVLPSGITPQEELLAVNHEMEHYRSKHWFDQLLYSLAHTIFWMNPFFLLLKSAMVINTEYQVDRKILKSTFIEADYKLSLIRFSVGKKKFALANGLSGSSLKKRILMMNNKDKRKEWRIIAGISLFAILLTMFCFACVPKEKEKSQGQDKVSESVSQSDTMKVELIEYDAENFPVENPDKIIVVLVNRLSKIMIEGKVINPEETSICITTKYREILESYNLQELLNSSPAIFPDFEVKIMVQKDISTDSLDYQNLLDDIAASLYQLREEQSQTLFGKKHAELNAEEATIIDELIPQKIYLAPNKHMGRKSD